MNGSHKQNKYLIK